jgi:hypothetical protein
MVPGDSEVVRKFSIDDATRLVVSSKVDRTTGWVLDQFPDQAVLHRKAFFRQMLDQAEASQGSLSDTRI